MIVTPPTSTVASTDEEIKFTCRAEGSAHPIVTWTLDGRNVTTDGRFNVTSQPYFTSSGRQGNASVLTMQNLTATDTAMVGCRADMHPSEETGNQQLPGDDATVPFTVLSKLSKKFCLVFSVKGQAGKLGAEAHH